MSNPLENWQAIRLNKPLTVNVPYFPEANIVAKEGEKIVVKVPEGSTVYIAIKGGKASQTILPIVPTATQPAPHQQQHQQPQQHVAPQGHKTAKNAVTYKPKANQPNSKNAATAVTNDASAATGAVNGGDAHQGAAGQQHPRAKNTNKNQKGRNANGSQKGQKANANNASDVKVITAEELKRQREEQAKHEAWLAQRREFEKKEREEQDRRYRERLEREKKRKEELDAKKKKELEAAGGIEAVEEKEGEKESGGNNKACWVCGSANHISRRCPSRCRRGACNESIGAHSIKDCKETCALCKNKGHDEWYCEKRCPVCRRGSGEPHVLEDCPIECRLCGAKGHRDRECEYSYNNRGHSNKQQQQHAVAGH